MSLLQISAFNGKIPLVFRCDLIYNWLNQLHVIDHMTWLQSDNIQVTSRRHCVLHYSGIDISTVYLIGIFHPTFARKCPLSR